MMTDIIIGVDIGGTSTKFGLVDLNGEVIYQSSLSTQTHKHFEDYIAELSLAIKNGIEQAGKDINILGIGIGAPNANFYKGTIENAVNLRWKGVVPIVDIIKQHFDVPVLITNDASAAAMGEMIYGKAKDMKDFIVITLGTGLGAGIVCNGKPVHGHHGLGAELGHVIINPQGRQCGCGRRGCLETYVSATGIKRTVYKMLADHLEKTELRGISFDNLTTKMIADYANNGDVVAKDAFEYTGQVLGAKLADTVVHTDPEAIFLFGGLSLAGDLIFAPTRKYLEKTLMPIYKGKVSVLPSGLQNQSAPILGASSLIIDYLRE